MSQKGTDMRDRMIMLSAIVGFLASAAGMFMFFWARHGDIVFDPAGIAVYAIVILPAAALASLLCAGMAYVIF
jgi:hypothetical protein